MDGPLLRNAFLYEYRGRLDQIRDRDEKDYMLHGDIKPQNILLDRSVLDDEELDRIFSSGVFPHDLSLIYPRVILADFGATQDLHPDPDIPFVETNGTEYYLVSSPLGSPG